MPVAREKHRGLGIHSDTSETVSKIGLGGGATKWETKEAPVKVEKMINQEPNCCKN